MDDSRAVSDGDDGDGWSGTKPRTSREETACFLLPIERGIRMYTLKEKERKECWYLKEWLNGWSEVDGKEEVAAIGAVRHRLGLRDSYLID